MGLSAGPPGVIVPFSGSRLTMGCKLLFTATKPDGDAFTAVKAPLLTAVKPVEVTGRGASTGGVGFAGRQAFSCNDAFNAADARIAGDSGRRLDGVF